MPNTFPIFLGSMRFQSRRRLKCEIMIDATTNGIKKSRIKDSEKSSISEYLFRTTQQIRVMIPKIGIMAPIEYENGPSLSPFGLLLLKIIIAAGPRQTNDVQSNVIPIVASV